MVQVVKPSILAGVWNGCSSWLEGVFHCVFAAFAGHQLNKVLETLANFQFAA